MSNDSTTLQHNAQLANELKVNKQSAAIPDYGNLFRPKYLGLNPSSPDEYPNCIPTFILLKTDKYLLQIVHKIIGGQDAVRVFCYGCPSENSLGRVYELW